MGIVQDLIKIIKDEHEEVDNLPFLQRYFSEDKHNLLTPTDHYRQLRQLLPIYKKLELKVRTLTSLPQLPKNLQFLLSRSEQLSKDIDYLEANASLLGIDIEADKKVLPSTRSYVEYLDGLRPDERDITIFAHFLTRILADLYGGQKIARFLKEMYECYKLASNEGIAFYQFPAILNEEDPPRKSNTLMVLKGWLDNEKKYIASLLAYGSLESLRRHKLIFTELETTRVTRTESATRTQVLPTFLNSSGGMSKCPFNPSNARTVESQLQSPATSMTNTFCGFFNRRNAIVVAAVGAAAIAATVSYFQKP